MSEDHVVNTTATADDIKNRACLNQRKLLLRMSTKTTTTALFRSKRVLVSYYCAEDASFIQREGSTLLRRA